jgi:hypothetical protein
MSGEPAMARDEHGERNRVVLRVLLTIVACLIVGSLLVGVRW